MTSAARREALEEEKRFLLDSLVDLEREHAAGDVDELDYRALKDSYTARAARLISELEQEPTKRASRGRSLIWIVAVVVLAAVAGVLVARSSGERGRPAAGSTSCPSAARNPLLTSTAMPALQEGAQRDFWAWDFAVMPPAQIGRAHV